MTDIILTGLFLAFILIREWQHAREVKLLSKALIAKNVYELKDSEAHENTTTTSPPELIPESETDDESFYKAIRQQLGRETAVDKFKEKVKQVWPTNSK